MVQFMAENIQFARNKLTGLDSNDKKKSNWEMLAQKLNALGGANKTTEQWMKV